MTTVLAILITWYFTKIFYTKKLSIDHNNLAKHGLYELKCYKCARTNVIKEENLRNPFYCTGCR